MKMRDKKKKKVNRIVKAGLALLCAGALLGGAVFGGGSVRVKAEGKSNVDEGEDATDDVKGMYYDSSTETYYVAYIEKEGKKLVANDGNTDYTIENNDELNTKIYIIWDTRNNSDDEQITEQNNKITEFDNKCKEKKDSLDIVECTLPYQDGSANFFDSIQDAPNKEDRSKPHQGGDQLTNIIKKLVSNNDEGDAPWYIVTDKCNIVLLLTDNTDNITEGVFADLEKQAIIYLEDSEKINQDNWAENLANEICNLKYGKVTSENGDNAVLTETDLEYKWIDDDATGMYQVNSEITGDGKAVITISSESDDPISDLEVKAYINNEELEIRKEDTSDGDNSIKYSIDEDLKEKTEQDTSEDQVIIKINGVDYPIDLVRSKDESQYTIDKNRTNCVDDGAYIYIESDGESAPEDVVAIINGKSENLERDKEYEDVDGGNTTRWKLIGSYDIVSEDSEDGIQIEVDGDSIGTVNLKSKNDDGTVCIEHITSTDDESYVFFSSKNDANGYYMPDRNSSLYKAKLGLEDCDAEPGEDDITYNVVWDLGADSYSNGTYDFDKLSSEVEELSNNVEKNKVNIIDCNGDKIDLSGDDTQKLGPDGDRKLTEEKLGKILSESSSPKDAYIVLTDIDGIGEIKKLISKDTDKLVYWINIGDPEKASIEKAIIPTAITDDEENGISKWDNAKNLIKSSVVFKFEGVQLTTDENGDSTTPVSITVDSVKITNVNIYVVDDSKNIIVKIWSKLRLWQKILIIAGAAVVVVLIVIMIIVSTRRKKARKRRKAAGGIPHGSPSSSPDVQLRSGVSPTAQTNVLARRAGEQNMQEMNNTVPANNTKQIQIQIIGRNPKIINTYINGSIFVGRANTCDVFINDATISRQHFALECVNGEVFIQPLVATNGTKLNGQRINDKHPLYPNDRIQIGTIGIVVRW